MSKKVSITLDDEILAFIDQLASNRSRFINDILRREKHRIFMRELEEAYIEEADDPALKAERDLWDVVASDGLDAQ